ncbi:MAG: hypothetical protein ACYTHJ_08170 [Planctomycetota bacterium]|jgi:tetratricopeptide (TPR) repeat protein
MSKSCISAGIGLVALCVVFLGSQPLRAQQRGDLQPGRGESRSMTVDSASAAPIKMTPYGQLHRDFGFPGAVRAWERFMYLNPRFRGGRSGFGYTYRFDPWYGPWGRYVGCGSSRRFNSGYSRLYGSAPETRIDRTTVGPNSESYSLQMDQAYALGTAPEPVQDRLQVQAQYALEEYENAMNSGYAAFEMADYPQAARHFLLATQLNHGDPSSRLCAAHAEVAVGNYSGAAELVRRAFALQPKLVYISVDIPSAYSDIAHFNAHLQALEVAVRKSDDAQLHLLMGYYYHNSNMTQDARMALARARALDDGDRVIARFAVAAGVGNR